MLRREFMWWVGASSVTCVIGCHDETTPSTPSPDAAATSGGGGEGGGEVMPADAAVDGCIQSTVAMHDTYAQALYLDGTLGPLTGTITVAQVIASATITMDFWHGHGGVVHRFTLGPSHFDALKRGERITVGTTTVEGHAHTLFIDPRDEHYRVPGAPDVQVPLGC